MIETFQHNGYTVEIYVDEYPDSPREWDNLSQIVCFHNRYELGDKHNYRFEDFDGWDELKKQITKDFDPVAIVPIYLFDHSGLSIATDCEMFRAFDSHGWDWGQVGFAFTPRKKFLQEFNKKRMSPKLREIAEKGLQSEVKTYGQYLSGEVYCYIIKDGDGKEIDSCDYGMYGYDDTVAETKLAVDESN